MLQDLYDDGFVFAGLLWVRFGGFLFREETGLMGLGFGIVSLGFHIVILGLSFIPCFSFYHYFIINVYKLTWDWAGGARNFGLGQVLMLIY